MGTISENASASKLINPEMLNIVIPNSAVVAMAYYGEVGYSNSAVVAMAYYGEVGYSISFTAPNKINFHFVKQHSYLFWTPMTLIFLFASEVESLSHES